MPMMSGGMCSCCKNVPMMGMKQGGDAQSKHDSKPLMKPGAMAKSLICSTSVALVALSETT